MKRQSITTLLFSTCALAGFLMAPQSRAATMYASGTGTLLRGDTTLGDFPGFYGGNLTSFPVPLTEAQARLAVLGAPDDSFLSLPGGPALEGKPFPGAYIELTFPSTFIATGNTLTIYETGDSGEKALLWLIVAGPLGPGFFNLNASVRNVPGGFSFDLTGLQSILDSAYGPGAVFTGVAVGGLDLLGRSQGFDLDAVSVSSTASPEPGTLALMGLALAAAGLVKRRRCRRPDNFQER